MELSALEIPGPPLEDYFLLDEIGSGAFGVVSSYKRKDVTFFTPQRKSLPEMIAVKTVLKRKGFNIDRELNIGLSVSHENIIKMFGVSMKENNIYIKMELANTDLSRLKETIKCQRFDSPAVSSFGYQILSGLCYLHDKSISHRDLKPQNILACWRPTADVPIASEITLKLSDFGLSRYVHSGVFTATAVGTWAYMAPEVALSFHRKDRFHGDYKKADVFAVGVIVYEMLHGARPFTEVDLLSLEELPMVYQNAGKMEKRLTRFFENVLKWSIKDRCCTEDARKCFRMPATKPYMEKVCGIDCMKELHKAAEKGDLEEADWLVDSGDDINKADDLGWTPLHFACSNGHLSVAQLLIEKGADVDRANKGGWTPLHQACQNGHLLVAELLIEQGADVDRSTNGGWTSFLLACNNGHLLVAQLLIEGGADVERVDNDGRTPLILASQNSHLSVAQFLIERGADVDSTGNDGCTPLHFICKNGNLSVAQLLIERGADVDRSTKSQETPLHIACYKGHLSVAQLLLERGADVDIATNHGATPLHYACYNGHLSVAQLLIERGDFNKADCDGQTPLHWASCFGHTEVAELLVQNGADMNIRDKDGETPVDLLNRKKSAELYNMLKKL